jgi:spore maturation protein CgeB
MKVLILSPGSYTLDKTFRSGLGKLGHEVVQFDYRESIKEWKNYINVQVYRLPFKYREKWEVYFMDEINRRHIEKFDSCNPDIVFIYNNEMIHPSTLKYFRTKSKVIFFLGDNPYYTPTNNFYIRLLEDADLIISPDSFWIKQLELIGIKNLTFELFGFNEEINHIVTPTEDELSQFGTDVLFVGAGYANSWGYKRAKFLSCFTGFNLKVYGDRQWYKWINYFPELEKNFILQKRHLSFEEVNLYCNCAKVYPVDANPGILNGLHVRIFDCIGSGILPLVEFREDINRVFRDIEIPTIHRYDEAYDVACKYINDEVLRKSRLDLLRKYAIEFYSPDKVLKRILGKL